MDRFLDFLRTGTIGGLGVGASAVDVRQTLGPPHDTSAINPPIWRYGQTEITFRNGYVVMIAVRGHADAAQPVARGFAT